MLVRKKPGKDEGRLKAGKAEKKQAARAGAFFGFWQVDNRESGGTFLRGAVKKKSVR